MQLIGKIIKIWDTSPDGPEPKDVQFTVMKTNKFSHVRRWKKWICDTFWKFPLVQILSIKQPITCSYIWLSRSLLCL